MIKGCVWIVLGLSAIAAITICAFLLMKHEEWCNNGLNAGDCKPYDGDSSCFCIDEDNENIEYLESGMYEHAQARCQMLDGSLAAPDDDSMLKWLSKRIYMKGIDIAYVGLVKMEDKWFWMKPRGPVPEANVFWRPDFPPIQNQSYGVINVATLITEADDYEYIAYNYDHYIDTDRTYLWYGFSTSNNQNSIRGTYFICHYTSKPMKTNSTETKTTTMKPNLREELIDDCYCSNNEYIQLDYLNDSQSITSPGYPKNYCSDHNCRWIVHTEGEGLAIKVHWSVFHTEDGMDFAYVFDGESSNSQMLTICTGVGCNDQQSTRNHMHIHFHTDHVITNLGFKATVTAVERDVCYCSEVALITFANKGDSFNYMSPKYPRPYCNKHSCKKIISAPKGYGLYISWYQFDLGQRDSISIYDGNSIEDELVQKCSGLKCDSVLSSGEQLLIHFESDDQDTANTGFSAAITSVQNYCKKSDLPSNSGSFSYSSERADGHIPSEAIATLTCPADYKLALTVDDTTTQTTCKSPNWDSYPPQCVKTCDVHFASADFAEAHLCDFGDNKKQTTLVANGDDVTIHRYNFMNQTRPSNTPEQFHCVDHKWLPNDPPACHTVGILVVSSEFSPYTELWGLYSPFDDRTTISSALEPYDKWMRDHNAVILTNGNVLIMGGTDDHEDKYTLNRTRIVNFKSGQVTEGPRLNFDRRSAATAIRNDGTVFLCGGQWTDHVNQYLYYSVTLKSCEVLEENRWSLLQEDMLQGRYEHALVATKRFLYALGGSDEISMNLAERYSFVSKTWQPLQPMMDKRSGFAAAQYHEDVVACGGSSPRGDTCEIYRAGQGVWESVASMLNEHGTFALIDFNGRFYAVGGWRDMLVIESYDPQSNKWQDEFRIEIDGHDGVAAVGLVPFIDWPN